MPYIKSPHRYSNAARSILMTTESATVLVDVEYNHRAETSSIYSMRHPTYMYDTGCPVPVPCLPGFVFEHVLVSTRVTLSI